MPVFHFVSVVKFLLFSNGDFMLIFHEGLPGSGKSYEAVVKQILPALKKGRMVYAWVDGLDHAKIADVLQMELSVVQSLLIQVDRDDVPRIYSIATKNSLVVIDELARFWPVGKSKIDGPISDFIKEHRHLGIDILAMDQDLRDCHALWKRRVDQKVQFMKLDMLGKPSSYKWTLFKAKSGENFEKISTGVETYDRRYFGIYKSHVSDDIDTAHFEDKRSVLWNSKLFRVGLAFVVLVAVLVPWYLFRFFNPETSPLVQHKAMDQVKDNTSVVSLSVDPGRLSSSSVSAVGSGSKSVASAPAKPRNDDYIGRLAESYRVRLVTVLASPTRAPYVVVEFRDSSYRVQDRLDSVMLAALGWGVEVKGLRLVILYKPGQDNLVATAWPLEPFGEVSGQQNQAVRDSSPVSKSSSSPSPSTGVPGA